MTKLAIRRDIAERRQAGESFASIANSYGISVKRARNIAEYYRRIYPEYEYETQDSAPIYDTPAPDELTLEEFVELARRSQRVLNIVDPQPTHATITLPDNGKPRAIIFASCLHLGGRYTQHQEFVELLYESLKIDGLYWFMLGDDVEGMAGFFDTAAASEQAIADPRVQRKMLALVLDKIAAKKRLLVGFAGQHGADWQRRKTGEDPIKQMYLARHVPYFDGQAYIKFNVGEESYRIFGAHQLPGSSQYNKTHAQKRAALFKAPSADVIVQGDKHSGAIQRVQLDTWEYLAGERPTTEQWYVQVGTAKTGPDHYTVKNWSPGVWDWPILLFHPTRHEIIEAPDLKVAKLLLENWQ